MNQQVDVGDGMADYEWVSTKTAAETLGVPMRVLYRLIDEGRLPAYKFGRLIRLRRAEIEAFMDDGPGSDD